MKFGFHGKIIMSLKKIAQKYEMKIIQIKNGDKYCKANGIDTYLNSSYVCGDDIIYLGIYDNEQNKIASFFHELGHHIMDRNFIKKVANKKEGTFLIEKECWKIGFSLAKEYGYDFNKEVYDWAEKQLMTYIP
jgi:Zn-dependent peptidase ImmA (M78 family)